MINFYILSKRFFLKSKKLSDAKVVSITKEEYAVHSTVLQYTFYKDPRSLESRYLMND